MVSIRVITPSGEVKNLKADDPEIAYFLSTEGQMGVIVKAILRVGRRPSQGYPFVIPFDETRRAYDFVQTLSHHPLMKPGDLIVYHSSLVRALKKQSNGGLSVEEKDLVLAVFEEEGQVPQFEDYLKEQGIEKGDPASAHHLWNERFLPMSIKHLGPSLLAAEVILPIDQVTSRDSPAGIKGV